MKYWGTTFTENRSKQFTFCKESMKYHLRFVHTRDVDLAILLSDAISIEILPPFQIATAGDSDNVQCFLACVNTTLPTSLQRNLLFF